MRMMTFCIAGVLAVACGGAMGQSAGAGQKVYRWTDANGVTHYSESPPARGSYQTRTIANPPPAPAPAPATTAGTEATPPGAACTRARENLRVLRSDQAVRMEGSDVLLTPEQRQAQIEVAEAAERANCSTP